MGHEMGPVPGLWLLHSPPTTTIDVEGCRPVSARRAGKRRALGLFSHRATTSYRTTYYNTMPSSCPAAAGTAPRTLHSLAPPHLPTSHPACLPLPAMKAGGGRAGRWAPLHYRTYMGRLPRRSGGRTAPLTRFLARACHAPHSPTHHYRGQLPPALPHLPTTLTATTPASPSPMQPYTATTQHAYGAP